MASMRIIPALLVGLVALGLPMASGVTPSYVTVFGSAEYEEVTSLYQSRSNGHIYICGSVHGSTNLVDRLPSGVPIAYPTGETAGPHMGFVMEFDSEMSNIIRLVLFSTEVFVPGVIAVSEVDGKICLGGLALSKSTAAGAKWQGHSRTSLIVRLTADGSDVDFVKNGMKVQSYVD